MFIQRRRLIIIILCFLSLAANIPEASALTIAPYRVDNLYLEPGQTGTIGFSVYNETAQAREFEFRAFNFVAGDEHGLPDFLSAEESRFGLASWLVFPETRVSLLPDQEKHFRIEVNAPPEAQAGGHYCGVFLVETNKSDSAGGSAAAAEYGAGMLVLLTVAGDYSRQGSIDEFSTKNNQKLYSESPVDFVLKVKNTGTVHLKPQGVITITNMLGRPVADVSANQPGVNALPGGARLIDSRWPENKITAPRRGFIQTVNAQLRDFHFGYYTAQAQLIIGPNNTVETARTSFWIIPWQLLLFFLFFILGAAGMFFGYNRLLRARIG